MAVAGLNWKGEANGVLGLFVSWENASLSISMHPATPYIIFNVNILTPLRWSAHWLFEELNEESGTSGET